MRTYLSIFLTTILLTLMSCSFSGDEDEQTLPDIDDDDDIVNDDDDIVDDDDDPNQDPWEIPHPSLIMTPEQKEIVLARADDDAYIKYVEGIGVRAQGEYRPGLEDEYRHQEEGHNAGIALANAFLAYVFDDEEAGRQAVEFLLKIRTDFETQTDWDANISMPSVTQFYTGAWDLMMATPYMTAEEGEEIRARIAEVTQEFFDEFLNDEIRYTVMLQPTQNNHNIHTASAVAFPAIAFAMESVEGGWLDFAFSELGYLFSPIGHYIYADGGVSEGPHYWSFAIRHAYQVFFALDNLGWDTVDVEQDCRLRNDNYPWLDHGCIDSSPYTFENPLRTDFLRKALEWFVRLRIPAGYTPAIDDGSLKTQKYLRIFNGVYENSSYFPWHVLSNDDNGIDTQGPEAIYALIWYDEHQTPEPPPWPPTQFLIEDGHAMLRTGWGKDDLWVMLSAEYGPTRVTVHDHIDNNHIQLAAYGEYLLLDTGYYKPDPDNAITAHASNHSMVLVDGLGPIDKGVVFDKGGEDAFLENPYDGDEFDYVEGRTFYSRQETGWTRSVLMVDNRYAVMGDFISADAEHQYSWRMHGYAGKDSGGTFAWLDNDAGGRWERPLAGVDVHVTATAPVTLAEAPSTGEGSRDTSVNTLNGVQHHFVMDADCTGQNEGYLSVLFPYRVEPLSAEENPAIVTPLIAPTDTLAYRIERGDGKIDVALLNITGVAQQWEIPLDGEVPMDGGALKVVETDARFTVIVDVASDSPSVFVARGSSLSINGTNVPLEGDPATTAVGP